MFGAWCRGGVVIGLAALAAVGCGDDAGEAVEANTSGATGATQGTPPATTGGSDGGDTTAADSGGAPCAAFECPPDGGSGNACDPRAQDCPEGDKCTASAADGGGAWNVNTCVPETGLGVAGDACQTEGDPLSGIDDCAAGSICLFVDSDNVGVCVAFCSGDSEDCPRGNACIVGNDGVLPLCLDMCNPLVQDCAAGQGCYESPDGSFVCFADGSGPVGLDDDPCPPVDGENLCDPGLWCGPGSSGCATVNCCTPYCDLSAPDCIAPDECLSLYGDPRSAPPGLEAVGVCALP